MQEISPLLAASDCFWLACGCFWLLLGCLWLLLAASGLLLAASGLLWAAPGCFWAASGLLLGCFWLLLEAFGWVGTQFLVYDLDRLRKGVGADKLNVYGYSYGTYVGGVYASVFSETTGRIVLDGDMEALPRKEAQAVGDGIANDAWEQVVARLLTKVAVAING
eukprot:Skav203179  [mRNA]  locus=scaffold39:205582:207268:+ [translate_table: standard]